MRAITVRPGQANSSQLDDMSDRPLATADKEWLSRLITRRPPLNRRHEAFENRKGDIKVALDFSV